MRAISPINIHSATICSPWLMRRILAAICAISSLISAVGATETISGVLRIVDGDTVEIGAKKIRLAETRRVSDGFARLQRRKRLVVGRLDELRFADTRPGLFGQDFHWG
jgi:hypothetical protein